MSEANPVTRWLLLLAAALASAHALGAGWQPPSSAPQERVVTADVVSTTVVERRDGPVTPLAKWRVRVRDVRIIQGPDPGLPGIVEFETVAGDISGWPRMGRIGLLVRYTSKSDVELLQWSPVYETVCFQGSGVVEDHRYYYDDDARETGMSCTSVRERVAPVKP